MYAWLRPQNAIPVHGEDRHLREHARMAREEWGAQSIAPHNGDVIVFDAKEGPKRLGRVSTGRIGLDGKRLVPIDGAIVSEREKLADGGLISIAMTLDKKGRVDDAEVGAFGLQEAQHREAFISEIEALVRRSVDHLASKQKEDVGRLRQSLVKEISGHCYGTYGKRPVIMMHIL